MATLFEPVLALIRSLESEFGLLVAFALIAGAVMAAGALGYYLTVWAVDGIADAKLGGSISRRPRAARKAIRSKKQRQMDAMKNDELEKWVGRRPSDAVALEAWCGRLQKSGDQRAYARAAERLLEIKSELAFEEKCMLYLRIADLYVGPLDQPLHARELLRKFVRNYPKSQEAEMVQERIARISESLTAPASTDATKRNTPNSEIQKPRPS